MGVLRTTMLAAMAALSVASCATEPYAPRVAVMPAAYKPFSVFEQDQAACLNYASMQTAGGAQRANNQAVSSGVLGAALGALVGGAFGGRHSTGIGAATGAAIGASSGAQSSREAQYGLQQQYDVAYSQCMYARGDQVPGYAAAPAPPPPR
ncbi:MAG: hypothetical protein QM773_06795 [Hyphomonadaceae bacterium]